MEIEKFKKILQDFRNGQITSSSKETFISICGFPHYEKVISSILAFFLDTTREHGLKNLFVHSLHDLLDIDFDYSIDFHSFTEVRTDNGNYIDIIIQSDEMTIVIENKIYAKLNNDLNDYFQFAKDKCKKITQGVILGIDKIESANSNFISITYEQLIEKLRCNLGEYVTSADSKYTIFLYDFIENIESLTGKVNMNKEFFTFINENADVIYSFETEMNKLRNELRKIVKGVNALVREHFNLPQEILYLWEWRNNEGFFDTAVCDYSRDGYTFTIDSTFNNEGWSFSVFDRNEQTKKRSTELSKKLGDKFPGTIEKRYRLKKSFPIDEKQTNIADFICELINKLM